MPTKLIALFLVCNLVFIQVIAQKMYYVKPQMVGNGNGSSWANAAQNLQNIINLADSGDMIWVAAGKYLPSSFPVNCMNCVDSQNFAFSLKNGVKIYGGFKGTEQSLNQRDFIHNLTFLGGDLRENDREPDNVFDVARSDNAFHVVISISDDSTTLLDGFVIAGGNAKAKDSIMIEGKILYSHYGGGIYCLNASPTFKHLIVEDNKAWERGGGMYNESSSPTIINTVFQQDINGIAQNYITSAKYGGGIYNKNASPSIYNTIFYRNVVSLLGGAIYNDSSVCTVYNCTIAENRGDCAGIYNKSSTLKIKNTLFTYNLSRDPEPHVPITYFLCEICSDANSVSIKENCFTDDYTGYFGNLENPKGTDNFWFTNDDGFHLSGCSPAINAGANVGALSYDILGNKIYENIKDIGAYETQSPVDCVKFSSFEGTKENEVIVLEWSTTLEKNLQLFSIERLDKGIIGTVNCLKDSSNAHSYQFIDEHPAEGINEYKLGLRYNDYTYSLIPYSIQVLFNPIPTFLISPNPLDMDNILYIMDTQLEDRNRPILVFDEVGRIVFRNEYVPFSIDFSSFPRGVYGVQIGEVTKKIIKTSY
jgi:hypothetical protein